MFFTRLLFFIIAIALGLSFMVYSEKIVRIVGKNELAEKYLGSGGTYSMWKILGMITIFVGLLIMMGKLSWMGI